MGGSRCVHALCRHHRRAATARLGDRLFRGTLESRRRLQVVTWLRSLHLPDSVADEFRRNAVAGADLNTLSDTDLTEYLGLAPLQVAQSGVPAGGASTSLPPRQGAA